MNKKSLVAVSLFLIAMICWTNGCKKDANGEPLEPISLIQPDSSIIRQFPGDVVPVEVKFTTDRPINWVKAVYDIDTSQITGYIPSYPDTFFFLKLDTISPRLNLYTYTASYTVIDTLDPYDVVRFKISFEAGKSSFTTGQNYPMGIVGATKEFRIDVR
jgi:hypothetical protein